MIKLSRGPHPEILLENGALWTARWVDHVQNGTNITDADKTRYRHPDIKAVIVAETADKCAYCESKISHSYAGDVEHILPKRRRPELFVDWQNLTLACQVCNTAKGEYYEEAAPLIDPYADEPDDHIAFYGPLVLPGLGSAKGEITCRRLKLSRPALVERRKESIESLRILMDRWHAAEGPLKDVLFEAIVGELGADREFSAALRAFAERHAGITI